MKEERKVWHRISNWTRNQATLTLTSQEPWEKRVRIKLFSSKTESSLTSCLLWFRRGRLYHQTGISNSFLWAMNATAMMLVERSRQQSSPYRKNFSTRRLKRVVPRLIRLSSQSTLVKAAKDCLLVKEVLPMTKVLCCMHLHLKPFLVNTPSSQISILIQTTWRYIT